MGEEPRLRAIVTMLAQRAGIPVPRIYIVDRPEPNAFATGRDPDHAAIAVTTGILQAMDERQLTGVLAHELSHVKNRDTLVGTIAATIGGAISFLAQMGQCQLFFGGGDDERRQRLRHAARGDPGADRRDDHPAGGIARPRVPGRLLGRVADARSGGAGVGARDARRVLAAAGVAARPLRPATRSPAGAAARRSPTSGSSTRWRAWRSGACSRPTRRSRSVWHGSAPWALASTPSFAVTASPFDPESEGDVFVSACSGRRADASTAVTVRRDATRTRRRPPRPNRRIAPTDARAGSGSTAISTRLSQGRAPLTAHLWAAPGIGHARRRGSAPGRRHRIAWKRPG